MKKIIVNLLVLLLASCLFAQNADIQKGIDYHFMARDGKFEYAHKAIETLNPFIETDAVACAYYGSSLTLLAAEAIANENPIKSLEYLEEGSKFLDKAVKLDSKNIAVRLTRLENGIEVSRTSPLSRYAEIKEDFNFLQRNDVISSVSEDIQAEIYAYCGLYILDSGDLNAALDFFDLAVETDENSDGGKLAQKMLDKYSE